MTEMMRRTWRYLTSVDATMEDFGAALSFTTICSVILGVVLVLCLTGCSTITSPTNELRLSSYSGTGGDGMIVDATGTVEGCRLVQEGEVTACVELLVGACRAWTCSIEGFAVPEQGKPAEYSQAPR